MTIERRERHFSSLSPHGFHRVVYDEWGGPASMHVKAVASPTGEQIGGPTDDELRALMNPWKALPNETEKDRKDRILRVDQGLCQKCHDIDNDVKWDFDIKWPKVAHPTKD